MRRIVSSLFAAALFTACANSHPSPDAAPSTRGAGSAIALRHNWHAMVIVERADSIILTLPSGDRQLQRFVRRAGFTLSLADDGKVTIRLDSLTVTPQSLDGAATAGAVWTGDIHDDHVNALRLTAGGSDAGELTALVRDLLPRLPVGGTSVESTWSDSGSGSIKVDIFNVSERRTADWSSGNWTERDGVAVLPVRETESFEQLGAGTQGGRHVTMTSQGRRSATYFMTEAGGLITAEVNDSVAMMISIPATRQVVPTLRFARTTLRYFPASQSD